MAASGDEMTRGAIQRGPHGGAYVQSSSGAKHYFPDMRQWAGRRNAPALSQIATHAPVVDKPARTRLGDGRARGSGTEEDPIAVGGDLDRAVALLGVGKHIRLNQPDEVSTLVHKLAKIVQDARDKGVDYPDYDLCKVTVPGTNLFCHGNKGIPRARMPQFSGQPVPGSAAEKLPRDKNGEVNVTNMFRDALKARGIRTELVTVPASHLRASQNQLVGSKVVAMADAMSKGKIPDEPIFVTRDGYVVDGHHRWAAKVAVDLEDGKLGDVQMPVEMIDMDIGTALTLSNAFASKYIRPKGTGKAAEGVK